MCLGVVMASELWNWMHAIRDSNLPSTTRHVLLTLGTYMNPDGSNAFPATKTLARSTGYSERTVCTHLENAAKSGFILRNKRGPGYGQSWAKNMYQACIPKSAKDTDFTVSAHRKGTEPNDKGTEPNNRKLLKEVQSTNPEPNQIPTSWFDENEITSLEKQLRNAPVRAKIEDAKFKLWACQQDAQNPKRPALNALIKFHTENIQDDALNATREQLKSSPVKVSEHLLRTNLMQNA